MHSSLFTLWPINIGFLVSLCTSIMHFNLLFYLPLGRHHRILKILNAMLKHSEEYGSVIYLVLDGGR